MITVAVIFPVLNEEKVLPGLLQRVCHWRVDEIVFVDGGSLDKTTQLLEKSGIKWICDKRGRAIQMNAGADKMKSDILLFVHVDTEIFSHHIEDIKCAMRDPNVVGGRFDVRLSGRNPAFRVIEWFINGRSRLTKISTGDQAMFVRRDVFEKLSGFPDQPLMEDIEFSKRLKRQGRISCMHRRVVTSSRRWEKHGIVRTVLLMWCLRFRYWLGASPESLKCRYMDCS